MKKYRIEMIIITSLVILFCLPSCSKEKTEPVYEVEMLGTSPDGGQVVYMVNGTGYLNGNHKCKIGDKLAITPSGGNKWYNMQITVDGELKVYNSGRQISLNYTIK